MNRTLLTIVFVLSLNVGFAGTTSNSIINGNVIDKDKNPLEFVNVTLLKAEDSTLVKGVITATDGKFALESIVSGNYFILISLVGYEKQIIKPFFIKEGETLNYSNVMLNSRSDLKEVTVTSTQPLYSQKPGMLVMNVENSAVKISGTAFDVVSTAPGVSIDQDANISLKGKSGVQIYIDGKPTYLSGDELKDYLLTMPASDIVRIEMMTTPPAKYNAEGSAGIINIVTQHSKKQGFNGTVNAGFGQYKVSKGEGGLNLNYGTLKYNIYGKYNISYPNRLESKSVNRVVYDGDHTTDFDQQITLHFAPITQLLKAGADFYPNKNSTFGIRFDASQRNTNTTLNSTTQINKVDSNLVDILHQINQLNGSFKNATVGLYFNQKLDSTGTEISTSGDYVTYYNRSLEKYDLYFLDQSGIENAIPSYQRSFPNTDIAIYAGQVDFTHPFEKKYKIDAGIKSSYVKTNNNLLFEIQNSTDQNWVNDTTRTNSFIYTEQINAAYISASADFNKWQVQAGLRAEQTHSEGNSPTMHEDNINNYLQLFPSVFVTQKINNDNSFQYTLARRINRPAYDQLNPFFFYVDQYLYKVGNPFLQPEIANNVDITHDYKESLFTSLGASHTIGGIAHVTHLVDSTGVMHQNVVNMNTIDNYYLNFVYSHNFMKWWINESSLNFTYNHYLGMLDGNPIDKGNLVLNLTVTETFLISNGWKLETSCFYQSPTEYSIFLIKPSGDLTFGVSKALFNNKLKCTLNISDVLYTQSQRVVVDYEDQHINSTYNFDTRYVYLRMRYNFGKQESAKKPDFKNAADDLQHRVG